MSIDTQRIAMMTNKLMIEAEAGRIDDDWACGFIIDMRARFKLNRPFSDKQVEKLEELFERY